MNGYFDANATTPLRPEARAAWLEGVDRFWANPSSPYRLAGQAARQLERCRTVIAESLDLDPPEIIFTSGATEANHAFFAWVGEQMRSGALRDGLWISPLEHPCVREPAEHFLRPESIRQLTVDRNGRVGHPPPGGDRPAVLSLMWANNETGVIQPLPAWLDWAGENGVLLHCDAVQGPGKLPLDLLRRMPVWVVSAHKFGGPKGVGMMRVSELAEAFRGQRGGEQEKGRRAGTENLPAILGMTAAWEAVCREEVSSGAERDDFERNLPDGFRVIGQEAPRIPNTSMLLAPAEDQLRWVRLLDKKGFQVSTGSACSTGKDGPSAVLTAMGVTSAEARRAIRISALPGCPAVDWKSLGQALAEVGREIGSEKREMGNSRDSHQGTKAQRGEEGISDC